MIDSTDHVTHDLPVTGATCLHFIHSLRGSFILDLRQDLLGDWVVTQSWSGNCVERGGGKRVMVEGQEAGLRMLRQLAEQKERGGYRQVETYHVRSERV